MFKICIICGDGESSGLSDCSEKSFEKIKEFSYSWHQLGRLVTLNYIRNCGIGIHITQLLTV